MHTVLNHFFGTFFKIAVCLFDARAGRKTALTKESNLTQPLVKIALTVLSNAGKRMVSPGQACYVSPGNWRRVI